MGTLPAPRVTAATGREAMARLRGTTGALEMVCACPLLLISPVGNTMRPVVKSFACELYLLAVYRFLNCVRPVRRNADRKQPPIELLITLRRLKF